VVLTSAGKIKNGRGNPNPHRDAEKSSGKGASDKKKNRRTTMFMAQKKKIGK